MIYKLINARRNQALLKKVPNLPLLDFAIVFYVMIPVNETENCSVLIQNVHMNYWKLPISVLYECAKENTEKLCPYVFRPLSEYVENYTGEYIPGSEFYILSNEMGLNDIPIYAGENRHKLHMTYNIIRYPSIKIIGSTGGQRTYIDTVTSRMVIDGDVTITPNEVFVIRGSKS